MTVSKKRDFLPAFEQTVLPHMDAAYNLARWIMGNGQDAEDMVQEAYLRAYQYFNGFQGGSSRAWLLTIVRNTCYTWLRQNRAQALTVELNEELADGAGLLLSGSDPAPSPEHAQQLHANQQQVRSAMQTLPVEFRELIVLREVEGLSYKEIAGVAGIPLGTVMSRLARARQQLRACLQRLNDEEGIHEL
jgi:RNA polymerase sigma-70 factor (ECF subfamily)